jgi:hypothetical protein
MTTDITASLTATVNLSLGGLSLGAIDNPSHASTTMQNGQAVFENDHYRITADDNNTVTITNKQTGEVYQVAGDPHVSVDGQHAFDFWGTTTFKLDDGTKVTIQTTPWASNPNADLASKVTITNGDYGVQITGVDSNTHGDLAIHQADGWGHTLDWAVDDGNVIKENPNGPGFIARDDDGNVHQVDQAWIDQTDLIKNPGLASSNEARLAGAYKDAFKLLGGLLGISFLGLGNFRDADSGGSEGRRLSFEPRLGGHIVFKESIDIDARINFTVRR